MGVFSQPEPLQPRKKITPGPGTGFMTLKPLTTHSQRLQVEASSGEREGPLLSGEHSESKGEYPGFEVEVATESNLNEGGEGALDPGVTKPGDSSLGGVFGVFAGQKRPLPGLQENAASASESMGAPLAEKRQRSPVRDAADGRARALPE